MKIAIYKDTFANNRGACIAVKNLAAEAVSYRSQISVSPLDKAWLYAALKPKGRDSFGVLLFLEIDTSNGVVTGDAVDVVDYLLEVDD